MDWTASGITNLFRYESVSVNPPYPALGELESITGGKITRSMNSDYRESMTLDFDGEEPPYSQMVRVWHTATLGNESVITCLGTFMRDGGSVSYSRGRYEGSVSYQSNLLRHGTDLRGNNRTVAQGKNVLTMAGEVVTNSGGVLVADSTLNTSKTFSASHVWEFGHSALEELQRCADALNAIVGVDAQGNVTLKPYLLPSQRAVSWVLTTDALLEGLKRGDPEIVNIVHVSYTPSGSQGAQFASARLEDDPRSRASLGRWVAKTYSINELSANSVQNQANLYMAQANTGRTWSVEMPYIPLEVGSRGSLVYLDGGEGVVRDCTIESMEIKLDTEMLMTLVLREV